jgi:hypothetical protein
MNSASIRMSPFKVSEPTDQECPAESKAAPGIEPKEPLDPWPGFPKNLCENYELLRQPSASGARCRPYAKPHPKTTVKKSK